MLPQAGAMRMLHPMRCIVGPHDFVYVLRHESRLSKTPHFWGLRTPAGGYNPKFELSRDFCVMHLPPKFHHPTFSRSEVIVLTNTSTNTQTNKRIPLKTSNVLRYAKTLGIITVKSVHTASCCRLVWYPATSPWNERRSFLASFYCLRTYVLWPSSPPQRPSNSPRQCCWRRLRCKLSVRHITPR